MIRGPGLFSDIGKKARDLLTKDYSYDQKFTLSTFSEVGVGITSTAVKKGGISCGDIAVQYKHKSTIVDLKVDTESNILTTFTISEILPSTKAIVSFKLPDHNSGKLEVQYFHDHAGFSSIVGLNGSPTVDLTGTIGTQGFAIGVEAGFNTTSNAMTKYNAGLSLTKPELCASVILADKGDTFKVSYMHTFDKFNASSIVAELSRKFSTNENTITVGGAYKVDPLTTVKARLNNHGKLGALLQHELKPKSVLTLSGEFDTKSMDKTPRLGLALALKP
ncbi:hypothetical protein AMTRI_Chr12g237910 [Amborella trichopoda]